MYPFIEIFGKTISSYTIMALIGGLAVALFTFIQCRRKKINGDDAIYFVIFAMGGLVIGAMILYQIVEMKNTIKLLPYLFKDIKYFLSNMSIGLVFYGGLYGALIGVFAYARYFKQDVREMFFYLTPAIPLFHIFGRIGCFLSGCCHGMKSEKYGIAFSDAISAVNGIPYLPVPLYEAAGDLVIFVVLLFLGYRKEKQYFKPLGIYLVLYGIMRFVLEFFRGDEVRGALGFFSTSQWISMVTIPLGIYMLVCKTEKNFLTKAYNQVVISKQ